MVIISLGTISIGQLTISEFNINSFLIAIILLVINFLNFYLYDKILENSRMQQRYKLIEASNQAYQNQLAIINRSQEKIRLLRHDMTNHLYKIRSHVKNNEYDELIRYVDSIENYIQVEKQYANTGNAEVDCLLNYKLAQAQELGVSFKCDITLPTELIVSSFDLTVILGNLLDNCLNALSNIDKKFLNIDISYSKGLIKINMENTYDPAYKSPELTDRCNLGCIHCYGEFGYDPIDKDLAMGLLIGKKQ